jgi:hypothetical protein
MMKKLVPLMFSLFFGTMAEATPYGGGTIIVPVQDLLFEATDFKDSPEFNLNAALWGAWTPELSSRRLTRAERKKAGRIIIDLAWEQYPDATAIRLWRGNLIIRLEDTP